jgi:predicted ATPase/DNA-binding CsgD family transcriptional regulator
MKDYPTKVPDQPIKSLTRREREILMLLAGDESNQQIADQLYLALSSVKWFVGQIYQKLGVSNRRQAVRRAQELDLLASPPAEAETSKPKHNLPLQLTSFIGREKEIAAVCRLLAEHRLVTLTGSGGTGKSRLALTVAGQMLGEFEHGVWLAELDSLADAEQVSRAVAAALGLLETGGLPVLEVLRSYVKNRRLLLVLDNCEHLLEACSRLVEALLRASPGLKILTTSREALEVGGEASYRVPELSMPDLRQLPALEEIARYEAVCLFADRAALALLSFQLTAQNAPSVVQICRRLDGIPLAIELAAARTSTLSVEQIAARLNDRFRLLTGGSRTALPRQQTLRASIDWSYLQLTEEERLLLRQLSVFAGGWALEAAENVCTQNGIDAGEVLEVLTSLVKKSLIHTVISAGGMNRFRMLETIREYAREKLVDQDGGEDVHRRHLLYFLTMAAQAEAEFQGPRQLYWINRLDIELDNLRTALEWGLEDGSLESFQAGLCLITALSFVEFHVSADEGYEWLEKYKARPEWLEETPAGLQAKTWLAVGHLRYGQSNFEAAFQAYTESLALYNQLKDDQGRVETLVGLSFAQFWFNEPSAEIKSVNEAIAAAQQAGIYEHNKANLLWCQGFCYQDIDHEIATRCFMESLAINEKKGNRLGSIGALRMLGQIASEDGDYERADFYLQKTVAASREMISMGNLMWGLILSGDHAYRVGRFAKMEAFFQEAQAVSEKTGFRRGFVWSIDHAGVAARRQGLQERAVRRFCQSLEYAQEYQFPELVVEAIASLAGIAVDLGRGQESARLLGALGVTPGLLPIEIRGVIVDSELERNVNQLRAMLGDEAFEAALLEGKALSLDQAVEEALAICRAGGVG